MKMKLQIMFKKNIVLLISWAISAILLLVTNTTLAMDMVNSGYKPKLAEFTIKNDKSFNYSNFSQPKLDDFSELNFGSTLNSNTHLEVSTQALIGTGSSGGGFSKKQERAKATLDFYSHRLSVALSGIKSENFDQIIYKYLSQIKTRQVKPVNIDEYRKVIENVQFLPTVTIPPRKNRDGTRYDLDFTYDLKNKTISALAPFANSSDFDKDGETERITTQLLHEALHLWDFGIDGFETDNNDDVNSVMAKELYELVIENFYNIAIQKNDCGIRGNLNDRLSACSEEHYGLNVVTRSSFNWKGKDVKFTIKDANHSIGRLIIITDSAFKATNLAEACKSFSNSESLLGKKWRWMTTQEHINLFLHKGDYPKNSDTLADYYQKIHRGIDHTTKDKHGNLVYFGRKLKDPNKFEIKKVGKKLLNYIKVSAICISED